MTIAEEADPGATVLDDDGPAIEVRGLRFAYADDTRRILDRVKTCDEWWACRTGFAELPEVERFVMLFMADQQAQATALIRNEIDQTHDIRVDLIEQILLQNPDATTWTGREGPYGMVSWWPTSMYVWAQVAPSRPPPVTSSHTGSATWVSGATETRRAFSVLAQATALGRSNGVRIEPRRLSSLPTASAVTPAGRLRIAYSAALAAGAVSVSSRPLSSGTPISSRSW